ncbi:MAG: ribosome silencing factor [Alphaproteobacteria bacterium]|nr:ribosome silencing factor [Alphaproteobacteria bacterium]
MLEIVKNAMEDMKAEDLVVIDLAGKTSIASFMVVASGTSNRHVASIAQKVEENLKAAGCRCTMEGETKADWVLIDAYDVIVHIFRPEVRDFYNLEKMWQSVANLRKE